MRELVLFSPAKVNLFFRVLKKRKDGYHDIASLVQMLDFGDTLSIALEEEDSFTCNEPSLGFNDKNLIYQAVALFKKKTGLTFSVKMHVDKRIPMQAGLGGGSGNAATTLYALNTLLHTHLSDETLAQWGKLIGADVPCFFSLGRVFCEGIGEKMTCIEAVEEHYWIAKPMYLNLSTPSVYGRCNVSSVSSEEPHQLLKAFQNKKPVFINDLEEAAFSLMPELKLLKKSCLDLGFNEVVMTGSGTAFICLGDVKNPTIPHTTFVKASSLSRGKGSWYTGLKHVFP